MSSVLLGVLKFPETHTAEHIKEAKIVLLESWGIRDKVNCLKHDTVCKSSSDQTYSMFCSHLKSSGEKSPLSQTADLSAIRDQCKKVVTFFRCSTNATEKLSAIQQ